MLSSSDQNLVVSSDVREYFHDRIESAINHQSLRIEEATVIYLVNLLGAYMRAQALFEKSADGLHVKPLAMHYADALNATTTAEKSQALRKLGDVALFISGFFAASLNRKLVDVDYYIAMGGTAYSAVQDLNRSPTHQLFAELAENFARLVDVLSEVSDDSQLTSNGDLLRLYESWLNTRDPRAYEKLSRHGVPVAQCAPNTTRH